MHNFRYSEAERLKLQNPWLILKSIGLKEGMCFIDLGCNDGFFTIPAAQIVSKKGKVYAIDIDENALNRLSAKLKAQNIKNTKVLNSPAEEFLIKDKIADVIFLGTVLHDFYDPLKVLINSKQMLKLDGFIYDYDWRKQVSPMGPPFNIRLSQEQVKELAKLADLKVSSNKIINQYFYAITMTL